MTRSFRAPSTRRGAAGRLVALAAVGAITALAAGQAGESDLSTAAWRGQHYRQVKLFDFDERPLGNFGRTPMYWQPLTGPGFPRFAAGLTDGFLDETTGHRAPPSFGLQLRGGNIAWRYVHNDLPLVPGSDYLLEGYLRAVGLEYASALVLCVQIDDTGTPIEATRCVSARLRSRTPDAPDEPWQRFEIPVTVDDPRAVHLQVELWLLQDTALDETSAHIPAPIVRQEVDAAVWFDDLALVRVPRVRLLHTHPGGLVHAGRPEACIIEVYNTTLTKVETVYELFDQDSARIALERFPLAAQEHATFEQPLPELAPGLYTARATLVAGATDKLLQRELRFAVLPLRFERRVRYPELGINLGCWPDATAAGAVDLVTTLGGGAVKVGLTTSGTAADDIESEYLARAHELTRELALAQIETTGVLLAGHPAMTSAQRPATYGLLLEDPRWIERVGPVFARFGGLITAWQLGEESGELDGPRAWTPAALMELRERLRRFVTIPQLVVPRAIFDLGDAGTLFEAEVGTAPEPVTDPWTSLDVPSLRPFAFSFWLPGDVPAHLVPWHLAPWIAAGGALPTAESGRSPAFWLHIDAPTNLDPRAQVIDLARRVVLAATAQPDRLFVPAPFEYVHTSGRGAWQPTIRYIPLRTLLHELSGRRAIDTFHFEPATVAVLFEGEDSYTLAVWTWDETGTTPPLDLYLGASTRATALDGSSPALSYDGDRVRVPVAPEPLLLTGVDAPLLWLHHSFAVQPSFLQLHDPATRPVLRLRNPWREALQAQIELTAPEGWQVEPAPLRISVPPGAAFEQPLTFAIPPRQVAETRNLHVALLIERPHTAALHFDVPIEIGLTDLDIVSTAWWEGDTLIIEQSLENRTSQPVSFNTFCQAPRFALQEGVLLNVSPGIRRLQRYRFPAARDLAGQQLWTGVQEIGGPRKLDQLVAVP
ncbi:MAG: hypothetical protein IPM18_10450 [Phycisphaerales bacterium]|nr:hypothetical protein [Phycisphaerales bacterium]